ncbi:hypothetical protein [Streptomyces sp. NPDC091217]|uniref:hypothetical protein n=1 Tax=Streptomyces sp. NPDC091217 TaxID=3365975 RepID=UPI0038056686
MERGLSAAAPHARVSRLAPADGGQGSAAAACSGRFRREEIAVTGPTGQSHGADEGVRRGRCAQTPADRWTGR